MQENVNNEVNNSQENKPLMNENSHANEISSNKPEKGVDSNVNAEKKSGPNPENNSEVKAESTPAGNTGDKGRNFSDNKDNRRRNFDHNRNKGQNFHPNNGNNNFNNKNTNDGFNKNQNWRNRPNNNRDNQPRQDGNPQAVQTPAAAGQNQDGQQHGKPFHQHSKHNQRPYNNERNSNNNNKFNSHNRPDYKANQAHNSSHLNTFNNDGNKNNVQELNKNNDVNISNTIQENVSANQTPDANVNVLNRAVENIPANNVNGVSSGNVRMQEKCTCSSNESCQCPAKSAGEMEVALTPEEMQNSKLVADSAVIDNNMDNNEKTLESVDAESSYEKPGKAPAATNYKVPDGQKLLGIRFKTAGEIYYIPDENMEFKVKERVMVRLEKGKEIAEIAALHAPADARIIDPNIRIIRKINDTDLAQEERNREREKEGFKICLDRIKKLELPMKLLAVKYLFDGSRITFYFKADSKVDFRKLVRELAAVFRTRIELRQIGPRDETELFGGFGVCGRQVCCSYWNCRAKSVVSAENQRMPLLSMQTIQGKIMGLCSRPLCCLRYEGEADPLAKISALTVGSKLLVEDRNAVLKAVDEATTQLIIEVEGDKDKARAELKLTYEDLTLKVQEGKIKLK